MERSYNDSKQPKKNQYLHVIETYRDSLSDEEMGVFLTLYEEGKFELAAEECEMTIEQVQAVVEKYIPKKPERLSRLGEPYKRRLTQTALKSILETYELDEDERQILESLVGAQNQVIAASSLGMLHSNFIQKFTAIRRKYEF